jgi:quercetin dioxygenase-like cupin family protein
MGQAYWFLGNYLVIVHVAGEETDDRFCAVEFLAPPDDWTPLHVHRTASQMTYVLEGELTFYRPGEERTYLPGECAFSPAGTTKTERTWSTGPVRMLDVNSPAGFDRFIAELGRPTDELTLPPAEEPQPDPELVMKTAAKYGIEILGPPGARP